MAVRIVKRSKKIQRIMQSEQITRVVLTGGPCAGKTTAVAQIVDHFSRLGYKVFTVPEIPTMVTKIGWSYLTDNEEFYYYGEIGAATRNGEQGHALGRDHKRSALPRGVRPRTDGYLHLCIRRDMGKDV